MIRSLILVIFGGSLLLLAIRRLKQFKLKERFTLLFLLLGLPFMALAIWPNGVELLARASGIEQKTVMLLSVSIFLILIIFELLRSEEHTSELQSRRDLVCRLLLEK